MKNIYISIIKNSLEFFSKKIYNILMSKRKEIANNIITTFMTFYNADNVTAENMAALRESFDKVGLKRRELTTEFVKRCKKGEFGSGKTGDQNFFAGHNIILKYFS